jgi:hypothetical protein
VKPQSRSTWFLRLLVLLGVLASAAFLFLPYSIRDDQGRRAGPDDARDRISLKPGRSHLVRPGRPACIYRHTPSEGESTELSFKVGSY